MKKIRVMLEIDLEDSDTGFAIVPTSNARTLEGDYTVSLGEKVDAWACKNSVTLKDDGAKGAVSPSEGCP